MKINHLIDKCAKYFGKFPRTMESYWGKSEAKRQQLHKNCTHPRAANASNFTRIALIQGPPAESE